MSDYKKVSHHLPCENKYIGKILLMLINELGYVLMSKYVKDKKYEFMPQTGSHKFKIINQQEYQVHLNQGHYREECTCVEHGIV